MLSMARAAALSASHRRHKKRLPPRGVRLFTKSDDSALQHLACRSVKSISGRCTLQLHPEKVQKNAPA